MPIKQKYSPMRIDEEVIEIIDAPIHPNLDNHQIESSLNNIENKIEKAKEQRDQYKHKKNKQEDEGENLEIERIRQEIDAISSDENDSDEEYHITTNMSKQEKIEILNSQKNQETRRLHRKQRNREKTFNKEELQTNLNKAIETKKIMDEKKSLTENFPLNTNNQLNYLITQVNKLVDEKEGKQANKRQLTEPEPGPSKKVKPLDDINNRNQARLL